MERQGQPAIKFSPAAIRFTSVQTVCHAAEALRQRQGLFVVSERAQEFSDLLRAALGGTNHFQGLAARYPAPLNLLEKQARKFSTVFWPRTVNAALTPIKGRARLQESPSPARHPCCRSFRHSTMTLNQWHSQGDQSRRVIFWQQLDVRKNDSVTAQTARQTNVLRTQTLVS